MIVSTSTSDNPAQHRWSLNTFVVPSVYSFNKPAPSPRPTPDDCQLEAQSLIHDEVGNLQKDLTEDRKSVAELDFLAAELRAKNAPLKLQLLRFANFKNDAAQLMSFTTLCVEMGTSL